MVGIAEKINFERTYYYSFLILVLLMPLSRAGISLMTVWLILLWFIEGNFKRKFEKLKNSMLFKAIVLFISFQVLSTLWTSTSELWHALHYLRLYTYWLLVPILATAFKKEYLEKTLTLFLTGVFISEMISYGVFFELWTFKNVSVNNPTPFMPHIEYSVYVAFSSLILLERILSNRFTNKEKIFLGLFFITVTGNLFIGIGRTGQLGEVISLFIIVLLHFKVSIKTILSTFLSVTTVLVLAYSISPNFKHRITLATENIKDINDGNLESSWGLRVGFGLTTGAIFIELPWYEKLLGVGLGDYKLHSDRIMDEQKYEFVKMLKDSGRNYISASNHLHSSFNMALVQTGVIGLFLLLSIFYRYFSLKIEDEEVKNISLVFATIMLIYMLTDTALAPQFSIVLFTFMTGIFISFEKGSKIINLNQ